MPCGYFRWWGKTGRSSQSGPACHLLAYHCLDVAATGFALLDQDALLRCRLAGCAGMEEDRFVHWVTFHLALHDVGKFSERFQDTRLELVKALGGVASRQAYHTRHDSMGFAAFNEIIWPCAWRENWFRLDQSGDGDEPTWKEVLLPWARAVMGHHGEPPRTVDRAGTRMRAAKLFCNQSLQAVEEFSAAACRLLLPREEGRLVVFGDDLGPRFKRLSWFLAGLAVLADWIGSDEKHFPYQATEIPLEEYWAKHALPAARKAVRASGALPARASLKTGMGELFPERRRPSPLQAHASECGLANGPQLFILEDAAGSGKTEAALVLAHRLMAAGMAEGLFVALPSMATANAMYDRLSSAYLRLFDGDGPVSLVLAHSARHLHARFADSIGAETQSPDADYGLGEESASSRCAAWLADNRKKALLANVGVGTLDQALIAVLPARHQSLRLLGLGRSVLIVDEVHACDPYMHALLRALLRFHAAQGGSAILLSATLPLKMRRELAESFRRGMSLPTVPLAESRYPLATHVCADGGREHPLRGRADMRRRPRVDMVHDEGEVIRRLSNAVAHGACACWMRNTVKDAIAAYDRLSGEVPAERLILFHSRFPMADRLDIERRVLEAFGPKSAREQRAGKLLIRTSPSRCLGMGKEGDGAPKERRR
ncbi:MAG: CRISPR-associated helicase Cas3' [Elusimicrobia bacterium]|nr:CRISPR-associated helicase Cas3' [Elusimicrobiota bacterium]